MKSSSVVRAHDHLVVVTACSPDAPSAEHLRSMTSVAMAAERHQQHEKLADAYMKHVATIREAIRKDPRWAQSSVECLPDDGAWALVVRMHCAEEEVDAVQEMITDRLTRCWEAGR